MTCRLACIFVLTLSACTLVQGGDSPFGESSPEPAAETDDWSETEAEAQGDVVAQVCERIDACGFLPPGLRVSDCEDTTRMCLDGSLQSELADWELIAGGCLQFENCFNFIECHDSLQACEVEVEVEGSTGLWTDASSSSTGENFIDETTGGVVGTTSFGDDSSSTTTGGLEPESSEGSTGGPPPLCAGSCDACLDCALVGPCDPQVQICLANPECLSLNDCYTTCEDSDCYDLCDAIYPGGVADYAALSDCSLDVCAASC